MPLSSPKSNVRATLWRVNNYAYWGEDPYTSAPSVSVLNSGVYSNDAILGMNYAGTGTVSMFSVNSSNQVVANSGLVIPAGQSLVVSGTVAPTQSVALAAQPTLSLIDSEATLAYAGSTNITGSVTGVKGGVTISAATTLASGYVYGVEGKVVITGTLNSSGGGYVAGVLGQLDISAATLTAGQLAAIWGDMGTTALAVTAANTNLLILTNTTNCIIHSVAQLIANASYLFDITDQSYGGAHFTVFTTAATAAGCLKILVNGNVRYLQCYSAAS